MGEIIQVHRYTTEGDCPTYFNPFSPQRKLLLKWKLLFLLVFSADLALAIAYYCMMNI